MKLNTIAAFLVNGFTMFAAEPSAAAEPKSKRFCEKDWDPESGIVYFKFGNGVEVQCDTKKFNDEIRVDCLCHGVSQKGGDSFAGVKGNYDEGIANVKAVIEGLYAGVWNAGKDGEGRPRLAELAEAVARIKDVELDKALAAVTAATDDERATWRSNAKVKSTIANIRAEKAAKALEAAGEKELVIDFDKAA